VDITSTFFLKSNQTIDKEIEVQNSINVINENLDVDEEIIETMYDYLMKILNLIKSNPSMIMATIQNLARNK
jgi:hypothetical protein